MPPEEDPVEKAEAEKSMQMIGKKRKAGALNESKVD
jgi:hypothetical protein